MSLWISIALVIALALLFGWLARRAWRSRRGLVRWPGTIVSGLLAAICMIVAVVALLGVYTLEVPRSNPLADSNVASSPEQLARGEHLAHLCASCHSSTGRLPLDGGSENFVEGLGTLVAPNLTPAGPLKGWSDGEIIRAIREGVDRQGRALMIMPAENFRYMSDDDVQALVAYLRSQPSVERQTPENGMGLLGTALVGAGVFPTTAQPPIAAPIANPPDRVEPERGRYLVNIAGCRSCHGANLTGGDPQGFTPVGPHLPAIAAAWNAQQFVQTIRTGVDPSGRAIDPLNMPWPQLSAAYSDEELRAIYVYLRTLPPG
jgi:mono/diheme cytochrome c family protein